jgi:hypothetical protein
LESRLGERVSSPFIDLDRRVVENVPTGIAEIDRLTGGLPRGAITEIFGPVSSGRTSTILTILAEAAARNEFCALVDGHDSFDPASGVAAGLNLKQLLWVRCRQLDQVLRTTDLLVQGGGFGLIVVDLNDVPLRYTRSIPLASWFRFQRAIEKTPSILVITGQEPVAKSAASLVLRIQGHAEWATRARWARQQPSHSVFLKANYPKAEVVRVRNYVRLHP